MYRWPTRCTILINNFYSTVFSCSTCFERITRSSSGALPNMLYYTVQSVHSCRRVYLLAAGLTCTIVPIVPNCVIQYIRQCSWWWTSKLFETCRARKNGGIKIIYKNCASHWSSTHCTLKLPSQWNSVMTGYCLYVDRQCVCFNVTRTIT